MSSFSLMPENNKRVGNLPLSAPTLKMLAICFAVLVALFIGNQYVSGKQSEADTSLKNAQAEQQQMDLKTANVKKQLSQLQASGGSDRLQLVTNIVKSQIQWRPIIMALVHAAEPGIVYTGGFSGSASTGSGLMTLPLGGTAKNRKQALEFIKRLKREKYHGRNMFSSVALNGLTLTQSTPTTPATPGQPAAPTAPQFNGVTWTITLSLITPPALPAQAPAATTTTPPASGGGG